MNQKKYEESPQILKDFYKYLIDIRNYSSKTGELYFRTILLFLAFIKQHKKINAEVKDFEIFIILGITEQDIISYISYLSIEKGNQSITKNTKLFAIKTFFNYIFFEYKTYCKGKENPAKDITAAKKMKKQPKYLSIEEVKKIINIFNEYNCQMPVRNNTIIKLTLALGLRLSEIVNINKDSIDFEKSSIKILGKGNKERTLYLNDVLKEELQHYINIYTNNNEEALFLSERKTRISRRTIEEIAKNAYKLAGLEEKGYTFHTLRHTAATLIYKETNGDILSVMQILGHESIQTTQIYTHIENNDIKKALNLNPIFNL